MRLLARPIPLFLLSGVATAVLSVAVLAILAVLDSDSSGSDQAIERVTTTPTPIAPTATPTAAPRLTGADLDAIQIAAVDLPDGEFARYSQDLRRVIDDVEAYWSAWFAEQALGDWQPPIVHPRVEFIADLDCDGRIPDVQGSYFCKADNYIALAETDQILPIYVHVGSLGVATVVSHEFGHAVQRALGLSHERSSHEELQADCFAGAWFGDSGAAGFAEPDEPLSQALGAMNTTDDGDDLRERRDAFTLGLNQGPQACLDEFPEEGFTPDFD